MLCCTIGRFPTFAERIRNALTMAFDRIESPQELHVFRACSVARPVGSLACRTLRSRGRAVVHSVPHLRTLAAYSRRRLASRLHVSIPMTFEAARRTVSTLVCSRVRHLAAKDHHPLAQQRLRLLVIGEENYHRSIRLVRGLAQPPHSLDLHPVLLCNGFRRLLGDFAAETGADRGSADPIHLDGIPLLS